MGHKNRLHVSPRTKPSPRCGICWSYTARGNLPKNARHSSILLFDKTLKTTHLTQQALIIILTLLLSGCFWPEKFNASLDIKKDRTFSFVYDGVLAFAPAVAEIKMSEGLSRQDDRIIAELEGELRKDLGFKAVSYAGDGRFKVRYERTGVIDRTIHISCYHFALR